MERSNSQNKLKASAAPNANPEEIATFELDEFFPYQVRIFYRAVSDVVSQAYSGNFDLSVSQWRTMAVLGSNRSMSASEIVANSSMDKVTVSRAIKGLRIHGFLQRDVDGDDKRRAVLKLTPEGSLCFAKIVPRVEKLSEKCMHGLSVTEQKQLISLMERVRHNSERLLKSD